MSEEKIRHIIEVFENDYCEKCSEFNCLEGSMEEIITAMKQLQQQNQKYKEVIDKAIKRLEKGIFIIPNDTNELLDILKEVE